MKPGLQLIPMRQIQQLRFLEWAENFAVRGKLGMGFKADDDFVAPDK